MMTPAEKKVRQARSSVVQRSPFFGSLLLRQKLVETDLIGGVQKNNTMATDGKNLYFNTEFVLGIPMDELIGVCVHESLHPGLLHHTRRGDRDPRLWNAACDYAINPVVVDSGFKLPEGGLLRNDLRGMTAEQIYSKLLQEGAQEGQSGQAAQGGGEGGNASPGASQEASGGDLTDIPGAVLDAPVENETERLNEEADWQEAMTNAKNFTPAGAIPGSVREILDGLLKPRVGWRELFAQYMNQFAMLDYTWQRPNRRFVGHGMYLPSLHSEQLGPVLFVVDASGSMPREALKQVAGELQSVCSDIQPEFIDVIVHDTRVTDEFRFEPGDPIEMEIHAGGGTRFAPVFDWIAESEEQYAVIVYFTDLETSDWDQCQVPNAPIIWVDFNGREKPEFGDEHVVIDDLD